MDGGGYHFTTKAISRGAGQSAVHTAAYNAREQLEDEREGRRTKDYGYKGDTLFSGVFAPPGAPAWTRDRGQLWNRAEAAEKRVDAQTARNVEFAVPHQLNEEQRERLVKDFVREAFVRRGMVADVNMHAPHGQGDSRNVHVHCLLTLRRIEEDEFAPKKAREWNSKAELAAWREKWAHMGARALERAGYPIEAGRWQHGHEPIAQQRDAAVARGDQEFAQSLAHDPGRHKGPKITAQERRGEETARTKDERAEAAERLDQINATTEALEKAEQELAKARAEEARQETAKPSDKSQAAEPAAREAQAADGREKPQEAREGALPPEGSQTSPATLGPREEAAQEAWQASRHSAPSGPGKSPDGGLKVATGIGDAVVSLGAFVLDFLDSSPRPGSAQKTDIFERIREQRKADAAMERIEENIRRGGNLAASDVRHLTQEQLLNIRDSGDAYLLAEMRRIEEERQRDREEGFGRARER